MNRLLLEDLQRRQAYPSVTILLNCTPGVPMTDTELAAAERLVDHAARRLDSEVDEAVRSTVIDRLTLLLAEHADAPATAAIALCASPEYSAAVRLGRPVRERVVIDDTFATRDLVADLNRTALFRVVTVSDRTARLLVGDRQRLVEARNATWPMSRPDDMSAGTWTREVTRQLRAEQANHPLPTVVAGVERSVRATIVPDVLPTIGLIPGNHDRSGWVDLHHAAWPLVADWLRADRQRAVERLDRARSARRYAGGIDEVWSLANDGRVELLLVEESYTLPARIGAHAQLEPADDPDSPDVVDDIVDDTIEVVLRNGGSAVIVGDDDLSEHRGIAAVLRY